MLVAAGCTNDVDPQWQLDHDRVIAVRASPPRIVSGEVSTLDALVGRKGQAPAEAAPDSAEVVSPASLAGALAGPPWTVTAPNGAELAAARAELELAADAPVPLSVRVRFSLEESATKIVWLGESAQNPVLDPVTIDNMDGLAITELAVPEATNIPLAVSFDEHYNINWLTSCGTMHDFDLADAYLRVEPEDPHSGSLAVVVRDASGGVVWHVWQISAQ